MKSLEMSTYTYDELFEGLLAVSVCGIVLSSLWIVWILVAIEANKNAFYSVNIDVNGGGNGGEHSLEMQEEEEEAMDGNDRHKAYDGMEVEPAASRKSNPSSPTSSGIPAKKRPRRVKTSYKLMQFGSVSVLLLLTYLLLVVSDAPMWASAIGSLCVFGIFLRYQIGDELRRQRIDRIALMLSLFLFIASLMSLCTYAFKSLGNGEIYEGPARIVGYDQTGYNNSAHDPSTRTDLEVQWGKDWGCPLSGGKVCQAVVQGAMCTVNLESEQDDHGKRQRHRRSRRQRRFLVDDNTAASASTNSSSTAAVDEAAEHSTTDTIEDGDGDGDGDAGADGEDTTEDLEEENQELQAENEQLQQEVEELELENQEEQELADEEVEEVEEEEVENEAIYDENIETIDEEELEIEEEFTDAYVDVEEEEIKVEEEYETDPNAVEEDENTIDELEDEKTEIDEIYEEYEDEDETNAENYVSQAEDAEAEEEVIQEEEEETMEEYEEAEEEIENGKTDQDVEDDWYWEDISYEYDDDIYDNEYWAYDWNSVWGEYACEDLFDGDMAGITYDTSEPAGKDDYPYINIYGSCKTCEAYILDYFAEEAFESVEEHKKLAIAYMTGAMAGFLFSLMTFIKYKVNPPAENEVELLGGDGGVMA